MESSPLLLTEPEVVALTQISRSALRRLPPEKLRPVKIGRSVRFRKVDVERFIASLGEGA